MKQLKSSLRDLRELFEKSITVRNIAEPLAFFDIGCSVDDVKKFMDDKDYDVIGVRKDGLIAGYASKSKFSGGKLENYLTDFQEEEKFPETTPLIDIFQPFLRLDRIFVLFLGEVGGIVTRGDFQKIPVRMWFFALVSLIEMHLLRIIREYYPEEKWIDLIKPKRPKRFEKVKEKYDALSKENAAIDLADCLDFCDKREIIIQNKEIGVSA